LLTVERKIKSVEGFPAIVKSGAPAKMELSCAELLIPGSLSGICTTDLAKIGPQTEHLPEVKKQHPPHPRRRPSRLAPRDVLALPFADKNVLEGSLSDHLAVACRAEFSAGVEPAWR